MVPIGDNLKMNTEELFSKEMLKLSTDTMPIKAKPTKWESINSPL